MTELTSAEHFVLDMLGDALKNGVLAARERLADDTIMVRIGGHDRDHPQPGLAHIERGDPAVVVEHSLSEEEALTWLAELD